MYVYFLGGGLFSSENHFVCPPAMDNLHSVRLYLPPYTSKEELQAGAFFRVNKRNWGDALCAGFGGKDGILVLTKEYQWWGRLDQLVLSKSFPERNNAVCTLEQACLYKLWSVDSWYNKILRSMFIFLRNQTLNWFNPGCCCFITYPTFGETGFGKNPSRGCWKYIEVLLLLLNIYLILLDPTYHKIQDLEIIPSP